MGNSDSEELLQLWKTGATLSHAVFSLTPKTLRASYEDACQPTILSNEIYTLPEALKNLTAISNNSRAVKKANERLKSDLLNQIINSENLIGLGLVTFPLD